MNKIIKKIKKIIKPLSKEQQDEIIQYYEEIINDRLDEGETIDQIDKSINYNMILNLTENDDNTKQHLVHKKEGMSLGVKILIIVLTFPLWIVGIALVISFYAAALSILISMFLLPVGVILIMADLFMNNNQTVDIVLSSGLLLIATSIVETIFYFIVKGFLWVNSLVIKLVKKIF